MAVKVSVIVPIYNMEDYLRRCLETLRAQTFLDFEVLMVDDGSTDGSRRIEEEFAREDPRFRLLAQANGGVASARNAGLREAQGEYLAFVDADDFVEPDFLEVLTDAAQASGADIACCNFSRYFPAQDLDLPHVLVRRPGGYSGGEMIKSLLYDVCMQSYLWNKLWRRELFSEHGIRFPDIYFEDTQAVLRLFFFAQKVQVVDRVLYHYTQRSGSIVHTFRPEVQGDYLVAVSDTRDFLEKQEAFGAVRRQFCFYGVKSLFFLWGAETLYHWQARCFRGLGGNLRRSFRYLHDCCGKEWPAPLEAPHRVFREVPDKKRSREFAPEP